MLFLFRTTLEIVSADVIRANYRINVLVLLEQLATMDGILSSRTKTYLPFVQTIMHHS